MYNRYFGQARVLRAPSTIIDGAQTSLDSITEYDRIRHIKLGVYKMEYNITTTKVTVTMKNELLARCDEEAKGLGMNRSAFVSMCLSQYFKTEEAKELLKKSIEMYEKAKAMVDAQGNTYYDTLYQQKDNEQ